MSLQPLLLWVQAGSHGGFFAHPGFNTLYLEKSGCRVCCGTPGGLWRGAAAPRGRKGRVSGQAAAAPSPLPAARSPGTALGCSSMLRANQELPLAGLPGAPGEELLPGPALGTAAWPWCVPITQQLHEERPPGFPSHPIPSPTCISLCYPHFPGPRHGAAPPAAATVSPDPGSELTCAFLSLDSAWHVKTLTQAPFQLNKRKPSPPR